MAGRAKQETTGDKKWTASFAVIVGLRKKGGRKQRVGTLRRLLTDGRRPTVILSAAKDLASEFAPGDPSLRSG
jgi:hypothetical protein